MKYPNVIHISRLQKNYKFCCFLSFTAITMAFHQPRRYSDYTLPIPIETTQSLLVLLMLFFYRATIDLIAPQPNLEMSRWVFCLEISICSDLFSKRVNNRSWGISRLERKMSLKFWGVEIRKMGHLKWLEKWWSEKVLPIFTPLVSDLKLSWAFLKSTTS
jgi:hypothetical protein